MRVLLANKFFFEKGGAEKSTFETATLLRAKGHSVRHFAMRHPRNVECDDSRYFVSEVDYERPRLAMRLKAAGRMLYSFEARRRLSDLLDVHEIDVAHLNNIYHQISPSILHTLRARRIPTVMSLRDYKIVCGSYQMLADGSICQDCAGGRYYAAASKRCAKDSLALSILTATEMYLHHTLLNLYSLVNVFISPSLFLKNKVSEMGFRGSIVHLPNFVTAVDRITPYYGSTEARLLYFGRLGKEKGLATLIAAVKGMPVQLRIVGEGPMREALAAMVERERIFNVSFLGYLSGLDLSREIAGALAVVVPSEWYENNPRSVIEAFAIGKTVIGANIGGIPELVRNLDTGLTFTSGDVDGLRAQIEYCLRYPSKVIDMGRRGRRMVETELSPDRHYERLIRVYEEAKVMLRDGR